MYGFKLGDWKNNISVLHSDEDKKKLWKQELENGPGIGEVIFVFDVPSSPPFFFGTVPMRIRC